MGRLYARFVWPKEIAGHVNPGAPEKGAGRLYQIAGKLSFDSTEHEGYKASIFIRVSGWSSGAGRRGNDERKLYVCSGDPLFLFNIRSKEYGQIFARRWLPSSELEWKTAKPYSYWDSSIVGLTSSSWANFPKVGAYALIPPQLEMERTEVLINFPSFLSRPATIKRHLVSGGPPPPPPTQPESSWEGRSTEANYAKYSPAPAPSDLYASEHAPQTTLQEYAGIDLLGMF